MKTKTFILFFSSVLLISFSNQIFAQNITVSGAITGNGSYATLSDAFTAINSDVQTSANINVSVTGNTIEPATGAILNSGAWISIMIQPGGGSARTISGAANAGIALIDLNGADNVTIDGLNTGGNSLTISNTTVSSVTGTSTVRLQSDAVNNIITNCTVLGSSLTTVSNNGGTIWIGANPSVTGNDNNLISFCNIGPAGANYPSKAIFINGTNAKPNNNDTIRDCNIYDYFNTTSSSSGIYIDNGTSDIFIKNNKFYQTTPKILSSSNHTHTAISINYGSGNNYQILENVIGYSSSSGFGTYSVSGASVQFRAIDLNVGTSVASGIQGNTITSISHSTADGGFGTSSPCSIIYIGNGLTEVGNISGNTIGSMTENDNITFTNSTSGIADINAITNFSGSDWNCSNNNIGGITVSNSSTGAIDFCGIRKQNGAASIFTCLNNNIGGDPVNSISNLSTNNSSSTRGILIENGISNITTNIIKNTTAAGGTAQSGVNTSLIGIAVNAGSSSGMNVSRNIIHSLFNNSESAATVVSGIFVSCQDGTNLFSGNFIHSLLINNSSAKINGIEASSGTSTYQNNMIRVGIDPDGNSINEGATIRGLYETSGGNNFYFNSIYIGGNPTGGSSDTYAAYSNVTNNTRIFENNIFFNARSNSGSTGKHYGVRYNGTSYNPAGLTSNYNNIFANGTGGVFASINNTDVTDIGSWQTIVGTDFLSFSSDPKFIEPNGTLLTLDLHINSSLPTDVEGNGNDIVSVTEDFDGQSRNTLTSVDIGADAGNFTGVKLDYKVLLSGANDFNVSYPTLAAAFAAVNTTDQTAADIEVKITGNTSEPPGGIVLFEGNWISLTVKPDGGFPRTVSGTIDPGSALIQLDGADNVIIDGLNTGGNSLSLVNSTVSSVSGTSTIKLTNDAISNLITNCTVLGSATVNFNTALGGVISFGVSDGMVTGNDNNVVSFCNIGPAGSNLPSKCIDFDGSSAASLSNSEDTIRNCNIYDYFNSAIQSSGIRIGSGNSDIAILSNKFYQTSQRVNLSNTIHSAIWVENPSYNFQINYNVIGFSNNTGTGNYSMIGTDFFKFRGIFVQTSGTLGESNIQGNTISGIKLEGTMQQSDGNSPFIGIFIENGIVNTGDVEGNTIGNMSGSDSIIYETSSNNDCELIGIFNNSSSDWNCQNNKIGSIHAVNTGTSALRIRGIYASMVSSDIFYCIDNIIGGVDSNSITCTTGSLDSKISGIYSDEPISDMRGNLIRNLTMYGVNTGNNDNIVNGITISANAFNHLIKGNTIHTLKNYFSSNSSVRGIYINSGGGNNIVSANNISSLIVGNENATIYGIHSFGGNTSFQNNMVQLGLDEKGNSITEGAEIVGIYENGGFSNFYFNSVYIGGSPANGTSNTFAFSSNRTDSAREYKNNIFFNGRSNNGSSGKHYSIKVGGSLPNPAGLISDHNDLITNGVGCVLGSFDGTDRINIASWRAATGNDFNSITEDPKFINQSGNSTDVNLHIDTTVNSFVSNKGIPIAGITDDHDGDLRNVVNPDIGADEFNSNSVNVTLNLSLVIEGFYDESTGNMRMTDTVLIFLRNASSPFEKVDSVNGLIDKTTFSCLAAFLNATSGNYYIQVNHRNSIETWSDSAIAFTIGAITNFDFTTSASQSYGSNQKDVDTGPFIFAFFSGDENQNGAVDLTDIVNVYNDGLNFVTGYVSSDMTGNNITDLEDVIITYNNSVAFVEKITP